MEKFATARKMKDGDFAGADIVGLTADEIARLCPPSRLVETEKG